MEIVGLVRPESHVTNRSDHFWIDRSYAPFVAAMDLKDVLAANLRRLRHERRLTQEELAEHAGTGSHYVGAAQRADVSVSVTVLCQIAEALSVEPGKLLKLIRKLRE